MHHTTNIEPRVTIGHVIKAAVEVTGVTRDDLMARTRRREICDIRSLTIFVARKATGQSTLRLGQVFDGRDHTTIIWALIAGEALVATSPEFAATADKIEARAREIAGAPPVMLTAEDVKAEVEEVRRDAESAERIVREEAERAMLRKAEMRKLRDRGWSVNGLARRFDIQDIEQVYFEIGEKPPFGMTV